MNATELLKAAQAGDLSVLAAMIAERPRFVSAAEQIMFDHAFIKAAEHGRLGAFEMLKEPAGFLRVNSVNVAMTRAFRAAVENNHVHILEAFGRDKVSDLECENALILAVEKGYPEVVKNVAPRVVPLEVSPHRACSPDDDNAYLRNRAKKCLMQALKTSAEKGRPDVLLALLPWATDPKDHGHALIRAVITNQLHMVPLLMDTSAQEAKQWALHLSVRAKNLGAFNLLVSTGDIDALISSSLEEAQRDLRYLSLDFLGVQLTQEKRERFIEQITPLVGIHGFHQTLAAQRNHQLTMVKSPSLRMPSRRRC